MTRENDGGCVSLAISLSLSPCFYITAYVARRRLGDPLWMSGGFRWSVTVLAGLQPKWFWIDRQAERYPASYKSSDIPVD